MMNWTLSRIMIIGTIILLIFVGSSVPKRSEAIAAIRQLEEAPGQVVYQARQTVKDQYGHNWQIIAFNRVRPDGTHSFNVRIVGFPGVAEVDRTRPLILTNSLGESLTVEDASSKIFTDESTPEPNVGQYNLSPVLSQLQPVMPLQLSLPTKGASDIRLSVSPTVIQEWQSVAAYTGNSSDAEQ